MILQHRQTDKEECDIDRKEIYKYLMESASDIIQGKKFHWFNYHLVFSSKIAIHNLILSFINACVVCESRIPGFAKEMIDRLISISGKEKHLPHYEQLIQLLAELHVINQLCSFGWPDGTDFLWEPTAGKSKKNPEIVIKIDESHSFGFEVKAPSLLNHMKQRGQNELQIPGRLAPEMLEVFTNKQKSVTLPRDNPVKDFLISADKKFKGFKEEKPNFISILVIVWDDFIYEPVTSLLSPAAGLLTENSFHRDENGERVIYENIDGIVLIRHLHQIMSATADKPLYDGCTHALDYGEEDRYPWKVLIMNPASKLKIPNIVYEALQLKDYDSLSEFEPEYMPQDFIEWY